jgi:DNA polymerase (family 10)
MEMGYEYIGISDHTKFLKIENGLNENQLARRNKAIDKLNSKLQTKNIKFKILKGCEANIMADGSIDISDKALAELDYVIAGIHSQFKMPKKQMTQRIIRAMENPHVDIIAHPTGRILKHRDEYEIGFDEILKAAKRTKTALEINAYPNRLDLKDDNIRKAKETGVKMLINSDSHNIKHLWYMKFGIAQARRGWAEKKDILNTKGLKPLLSFFSF